MNQTPQCLYEFDCFRLDVSEHLLLREGQAIPLTPKVFETLLVLVENRGRTMSKEELMQRLWPDSFVEEANLTQNISVIRRALGENSASPRFIETIPKRGYRFIAEVKEEEDKANLVIEEHTTTAISISGISSFNAHSPLPENQEILVQTNQRDLLPNRISIWLKERPRTMVISSTLAVTVFATSLIFWWVKPAEPPAFWQGEVRAELLFGALSEQNGMLSDSRFSPDGKMIAYSEVNGGASHIRVRLQTPGSRPQQITQENSWDVSPVWSPDGSWLAYLSDRDRHWGIWKIPALGGTPQWLGHVTEDSAVTKGTRASLVAWAKQDSAIYYSLAGNLYRFDIQTQKHSQLTHFQWGELSGQGFALAPDEAQTVFTARRNGQSDIWRVKLPDGTPIRVTDDPAPQLYPRWHPQGEWVFYNSIRDGKPQLQMISVKGGQPLTLRLNDIHDYLADVSPDGQQLLCYGEQHKSNLFVVENDAEASDETRLTDYSGVAFWPNLSPDEKFLAFHFLPGDRFAWDPRQSVRGVIETRAPERRQDLPNAIEPQWSPDGEWIAFLRRTKSLYQLLMTRSVGGKEEVLVDSHVFFGGATTGLALNIFQTADFAWSPDSRQIAYAAKEEGVFNIQRVEVATRVRHSVSAGQDANQETSSPRWSPDGTQLAWINEDWGTRISSVWIKLPGSAVQAEKIFQTDQILRLLGWTSANEILIALAAPGEMARTQRVAISLFRCSTTQHSAQFIREFPSAYLSNFYLSPDRRNVSFVAAQEGGDNLWILSLSDGEVRQVTRNNDPKVFLSSLAWGPQSNRIYFGKQTRESLLSVITKQP